jgi:Fe-S-cluster-containing dehydrogenase component
VTEQCKKMPIELEYIDPDESPNSKEEKSRRLFLKTFAGSVFAGLVAPALLGEAEPVHAQGATAGASDAALPTLRELEFTGSPVTRMMADLQRALAKPVEERSWIMVIDLRKCTGCQACNIACIAENQLPPGVVYRPVIDEEVGRYPNVTIRSVPRPCMQCENPPCVPVCPVGATWQRPDGIVDMDYDECIGCRYCMTACPYHARTFDFGYRYTDETPAVQPYEQQANFEYGKRWDRGDKASPIANVRKCHFCRHKLDAGMLPSCVTTCIGHATYFGDANDSKSLVSELIAQPNVMRLKEEAGTKPRVYYLM